VNPLADRCRRFKAITSVRGIFAKHLSIRFGVNHPIDERRGIFAVRPCCEVRIPLPNKVNEGTPE
jgi:hypothetical protein